MKHSSNVANVIDPHTVVPVCFHQNGTWGGGGFRGELRWSYFDGRFGIEDPAEPPMLPPSYSPILVLDDDQVAYSGLVLTPGNQEMAGQFEGGYDHPLAGKFYKGRIEIGDSPSNLRGFSLPSVLFCSAPRYLHSVDETHVYTDAERELILVACGYDRQNRFAAGSTLKSQFSRDEFEGDEKGEVYYA